MTTALDAIKEAYPKQYYGTPSTDGNSVTDVINVWTASSVLGRQIDLLGLPAASALVPMTEAQSNLAAVSGRTGYLTIPARNLTLQYPARFYCDKNTPTAVYDMWGFSSAPAEPALSDLYAITTADYFDRQDNPRQQYYDTASGKLADYTPPVVAPTLSGLAASEQAWIQQQANLAAAMGQTFTADMRAYVAAINAIAAGTDTTSTMLPARPGTIMS